MSEPRKYWSCKSCEEYEVFNHPDEAYCNATGEEITLRSGQHYPAWCPRKPGNEIPAEETSGHSLTPNEAVFLFGGEGAEA